MTRSGLAVLCVIGALLGAVLGALLGAALGRGLAPSTGGGGPDVATRRLLESLGYSGWGEGELGEGSGVVRFDRERSAPGFNLYTSVPLARAELLAADGRSLHAWADPDPRAKGWDHVVLGSDGDLYSINGNGVLERWDRNSRRLWRREIDAHHDLAFDTRGRPVVLVRRRAELERDGQRVPLVDDCLVTLDPGGRELRRLCLVDAIGERVPDSRVQAIREEMARRDDATLWDAKTLDAFHTNSLVFLDRDVPGLGRRGDVLLSVRQIDEIVVLDAQTGELRFAWGAGEIQNQHHATLLASGHVLLFDNGRRRRWSRVLEIAPESGEIVWQYGVEPEQRFFSAKRGSSQRLANGNVLITNSESGRVFEVTPSGDTVWEFANPHIYEDQRAAIYRMTRIPPEAAESLALID